MRMYLQQKQNQLIASGLKGRHHKWGKTALYHYGAQLLFNGLWSLVFFGLHQPLGALVVIIILGILIERSIYWFRLVDRPAAYMLSLFGLGELCHASQFGHLLAKLKVKIFLI